MSLMEEKVECTVHAERMIYVRPVRLRRMHQLDKTAAQAFISVWSNQSLGTSLALKYFDGENVFERLVDRPFVLVSFICSHRRN